MLNFDADVKNDRASPNMKTTTHALVECLLHSTPFSSEGERRAMECSANRLRCGSLWDCGPAPPSPRRSPALCVDRGSRSAPSISRTKRASIPGSAAHSAHVSNSAKRRDPSICTALQPGEELGRCGARQRGGASAGGRGWGWSWWGGGGSGAGAGSRVAEVWREGGLETGVQGRSHAGAGEGKGDVRGRVRVEGSRADLGTRVTRCGRCRALHLLQHDATCRYVGASLI